MPTPMPGGTTRTRSTRHLMGVAIATGPVAWAPTVGDSVVGGAQRDGFATGEVTGQVTGRRPILAIPTAVGTVVSRQKKSPRMRGESHATRVSHGQLAAVHAAAWAFNPDRREPSAGRWTNRSRHLFAAVSAALGEVWLSPVSSPGRSGKRFAMMNTVEGAMLMSLSNRLVPLSALLCRKLEAMS